MSDPNNLVYRDQLDDNVIDMLSEDIGSNASLKTENQKTITAALNEIYGKDVIANAVGDPLLSTDTYNEMGSKIKSLIVKLKNKLLSNGISITEYDKLNSLIEKIEVLEGSKEGGYNLAKQVYGGGDITADRLYDFIPINVPINIDFTPVRIIMHSDNVFVKDTYKVNYHYNLDSDYSNSEDNAACLYDLNGNSFDAYISDIAQESFNLYIACSSGTPSGFTGNIEFTIIGDYSELEIALINALKELLINKGVEVTGTESLAELILKVDEIKTGGGLDIISATELPATGNENQICVITENPTNKFIITTLNSDINVTDNTIFIKLGNGTGPTSNTITIGSDIQTIYRIDGIYQNNINVVLPSYIYQNGKWNEFTSTSLYIMYNNTYSSSTYGTFATLSNYVTYSADEGIHMKTTTENTGILAYVYTVLANPVNISGFNQLKINWNAGSCSNTESAILKLVLFENAPSKMADTSSISGKYTVSKDISNKMDSIISYDISSYTGTYYIGVLLHFTNNSGYTSNKNIYIHDIYFM